MVGEHDEKTAWHIASTILNLALGLMIALACIVMIFARQLVPLYTFEKTIGDLLSEIPKISSGAVAQHLVGAKLALRFPNLFEDLP